MTDFYNARTFSRVDAGALPVSIKFDDGTAAEGTIFDISMTGMRVDLDTPVACENGAACGVEFFVNASYQLNIRANATWNGGFLLGLRFESADEASFEFLQEFILANAEDPGEAQQELELHSDLLPRIVQ